MSRAQPSGLAALLSDYRAFAGGRLWLAAALIIFGALAEGFGLLTIVPLLSIASGNGDPRLLRLAPWASSWNLDQRFLIVLALFVTAMSLRSVLLFARDVLLSRLSADYEASLRLRAAATLAGRGWPFVSRIGQGGMQSLLLSDVPRASEAIRYVQNMAAGGAMLAVAVGITILLSAKLTLVALAFLAAAALLSLRTARRGAKSGFAISEAMDAAAGSGHRLHAGLKAALAQGTVGAFLDEYRSSLQRTAAESSGFVRQYSSARYWSAAGMAIAAAVLLLVGVRVLALPFPILVTSLVLFARMSAPAQLLQSSWVLAASCAPAFAAIERRLGTLQPTHPASVSAAPLQWRRLEIEDVTFEHQPERGLRGLSLTLGNGEWIGIRGASGAGKTTLLDLVVGLLSPQEGELTVDGRPIAEVIDRWQAAVAYAGQEGVVFSDSVRGNLLAEGADASDDELWDALGSVGLADRVRAFPDGLEQDVGDRGSHLSGGERQRLVLARALLRKPSLLILDEATAALDAEGEASLLDRLRALHPRPAALVVAHRESTLSHCDSVISTQHGKVSAAQSSFS
ncbi:MAG: ABC transporter ATP-binding protein [Sphingomonas sp.]|nr:ABC transporter ATP-binding protein [Sphingomonas sp.]